MQKTAKLMFNQKLPGTIYASWGGNAEQLTNGNIEYDACGLAQGSYVNEVTRESNPKLVWQMHTSPTTTSTAPSAFRACTLESSGRARRRLRGLTAMASHDE